MTTVAAGTVGEALEAAGDALAAAGIDTPRLDAEVLLVEPGDGLTISKKLPKLGYRGVEACEIVFDGQRVGADAVLGGTPNEGWAQMMRGLEVGRIQGAARALGVGQAALNDADSVNPTRRRPACPASASRASSTACSTSARMARALS